MAGGYCYLAHNTATPKTEADRWAMLSEPQAIPDRSGLARRTLEAYQVISELQSTKIHRQLRSITVRQGDK